MPNRRLFLRNSFAAASAVFLTPFQKMFDWFRPAPVYNILLGRPTRESIVVSILMLADAVVYIEYGTDKNRLNQKTAETKINSGVPENVLISNLNADQKYYYKISYKLNGEQVFTARKTSSFRTQRKKGNQFVFTVTADSHLGTVKHCDPKLYQLTLNNVSKDQPDIHFALGDDFRASKVNNPDYPAIEKLYTTQRNHLGTCFDSVPYFFILGNHELEAKAYDNGTENSLAAWSKKARKKYIPNPEPNHFYSSHIDADSKDGARQNYFSFEWGDALFVTLDVFWYSNISAEDEEMREQQKKQEEAGLSREDKQKAKEERMQQKEQGKGGKKQDGEGKRKDQWSFTLGKEQYGWLKQTLEKSKARYKFVMGHHVMGSCRGAVEWAGTFEWGGMNRRGIDEFSTNRPGWEMPIHQLFMKNQVTAFIQGHDHLFARQEKDGIAYITCPMCGDPGYNTYNADAYTSGDKLSNTGHLRFTINSQSAIMEYIKAVLPADETTQGKNGAIAYTWSFDQQKKNKTVLKKLSHISRGLLCCLAFLGINQLNAQQEKQNGYFQVAVPAHPYDIILSAPEDHSITMSIAAYENGKAQIFYGTTTANLNLHSDKFDIDKNAPYRITLTGLLPEQQYFYQLKLYGQDITSPVCHFKTAPVKSNKFVFTIQADSHLDENTGTAMYEKTLENMAGDVPDFMIDLGDTWMTDKYRENFIDALPQYKAQRYYFGSICHSIPLFLTLGNHDGEPGKSPKKNSGENMTTWAANTRLKYYANPEPDAFYSGNEEKLANGKPLADYYAWQWGNALFIVLDPFRYTMDNRNPWSRSLGEKQYNWLKKTLENSKAAHKFVFIHNLVGGADLKGIARGGAEAAAFYEWGGLNADSTNGFAVQRPGWDKPVHDLLKQYHVDVVFHGHDHFFARQEKDGIIYQLLPQPGAMRYGNTNSVAEYGYRQGVFLNTPGYLRVTVDNQDAKIEYIQTSTDTRRKNKEILFSYTIQSR